MILVISSPSISTMVPFTLTRWLHLTAVVLNARRPLPIAVYIIIAFAFSPFFLL